MQKDELRYSKLGNIIQIIILMKTSKKGLTLDEMATELNSTRRTAERVRDVLLRNFTQIIELESTDRKKRWGFDPVYGMNISKAFVAFDNDELTQLNLITKGFTRLGQDENARLIQDICNKISILKETTEDDLRDLLIFEGYAIRQYSTQKINTETLNTIRQALKYKQKLKFEYKDYTRNVAPYGLIYHNKNYLVALDDGYIKSFDLNKINHLILLDEKFVEDTDFDLKEYSERSFGVFQEKPQTVKLLFSKVVSADVLNYHFHPSQIIKQLSNGTIEVSFFAGGQREICWELFKWGAGVTIIEPQSLKEMYTTMLTNILNKQK